jgi:hypothetical protein
VKLVEFPIAALGDPCLPRVGQLNVVDLTHGEEEKKEEKGKQKKKEETKKISGSRNSRNKKK